MPINGRMAPSPPSSDAGTVCARSPVRRPGGVSGGDTPHQQRPVGAGEHIRGDSGSVDLDERVAQSPDRPWAVVSSSVLVEGRISAICMVGDWLGALAPAGLVQVLAPPVGEAPSAAV